MLQYNGYFNLIKYLIAIHLWIYTFIMFIYSYGTTSDLTGILSSSYLTVSTFGTVECGAELG